MKLSKLTVLTVVMVFAAGILVSPAFAAKKLKMGAIFSNKSMHHQALLKFADHVKKATNGDFEIEIFPSMQLGNDKEMYQMLKLL